MGGAWRLWGASAATLLLWLAAPVIGTAAADDGAGAFARIGPLVVHGRGADLLHVGLGAFDVFDDHTAAASEIQYRFGRKLWFIGPAVGLVGNTDGGLYGYVGLYADVSIGRLHLTPGLALGGYGEGSDSKALGGIFQFRQSTSPGAWPAAAGSASGSPTSPTPTSRTSTRVRRRSTSPTAFRSAPCSEPSARAGAHCPLDIAVTCAGGVCVIWRS
jgi:hypothetical protein